MGWGLADPRVVSTRLRICGIGGRLPSMLTFKGSYAVGVVVPSAVSKSVSVVRRVAPCQGSAGASAQFIQCHLSRIVEGFLN
jgi:hypothetical protein